MAITTVPASVLCVKVVATNNGQVVSSLYLNAVEATRAGESIAIRTANAALDHAAGRRAGLPPGRYAVLTVEDAGCGMDAGTLARVFEPFFTTKPGGRGLGLAAAYGIAKVHGGAITARSEPARGACFEVYLPANAEPAPGRRPGGRGRAGETD